MCDNGIGIAPEVLPHVFDLFVQAPQALDRAQGGLGVGLHLVQRLTALHGGTVRVESARGRGQLLHRVAADRARQPSPRSTRQPGRGRDARRRLRASGSSSSTTTRTPPRCSSMVLRRLGYDDRGGLRRPRRRCARRARFGPDVVVLDIGLPVMDGYEVARQLRAMPVVGSARIVALTGYGQASDVARSMAAGVDAHLVKPVDVDRLRAAIEGVSPKSAPPPDRLLIDRHPTGRPAQRSGRVARVTLHWRACER